MEPSRAAKRAKVIPNDFSSENIRMIPPQPAKNALTTDKMTVGRPLSDRRNDSPGSKYASGGKAFETCCSDGRPLPSDRRARRSPPSAFSAKTGADTLRPAAARPPTAGFRHLPPRHEQPPPRTAAFDPFTAPVRSAKTGVEKSGIAKK